MTATSRPTSTKTGFAPRTPSTEWRSAAVASRVAGERACDSLAQWGRMSRMRSRTTAFLFAAGVLAALAGCPSIPSPRDADYDGEVSFDGSDVTVDAATDAAMAPDTEAVSHALGRYCGTRTWSTTLQSASLAPPGGMYSGFISRAIPSGAIPPGTVESMTVIPEHPFIVRTIRVAFARGTGRARIRLERSFGRSAPASALAVSDVEGIDILPPVEVEVTAADPNTYMDIDVSAAQAVLAPGALYHIVYEHLTAEPFLAIESVPMGADNNALLLFPGDVNSYGVPGNYRMRLEGDYACALPPASRSFQRSGVATFEGRASGNIHVVDLDGDGNDDIVAPGGDRPFAYLGDGRGGFSLPPTSPFPADEVARMLLFGDLDNDGDEDAFAIVYIQSDNDGDTVALFEGDCNDTNPRVRPRRPGGEVAGNGLDDDCDGTTDDGTSTADTDADGVSIAAGDCDDTTAMVRPGATEILDGLDNNCNRTVDEGFFHHVLVNDGRGHFTRVPSAGVEVQGPTAAAAMDDANSDGRLDVFVGFWLRHYPEPQTQPSLFYYGNGDGTFREATAEVRMNIPTPHPVYGVMWNDWNNDGRSDLYVGHYQLQDNLFFRNNGDSTFTNVAATIRVDHDGIPTQAGAQYPGGHSYGGDFGDFDGDGYFDAILCNLSHPRTMPWADPTMFVINQGPPTFAYVNRREAVGIEYNEGDGNAQFGDFDNDGDLDVYIASFYGRYLRVLRNDSGHFVDVTYETGIHVRSGTGVWSDLDADGDLDFISSDNGTTHAYLNQLRNSNHWVELLLDSTTPGVNRDAVGARITLVAGGRTYLRDVRLTGGLANRQPSRWMHVGLGATAAIESVSIRWPGGTIERITGVTPDHRFSVHQGAGVAMLR